VLEEAVEEAVLEEAVEEAADTVLDADEIALDDEPENEEN
jgi:uncharacterized protein (DUF1778 family)